jgi:hypothetical protein
MADSKLMPRLRSLNVKVAEPYLYDFETRLRPYQLMSWFHPAEDTCHRNHPLLYLVERRRFSRWAPFQNLTLVKQSQHGSKKRAQASARDLYLHLKAWGRHCGTLDETMHRNSSIRILSVVEQKWCSISGWSSAHSWELGLKRC